MTRKYKNVLAGICRDHAGRVCFPQMPRKSAEPEFHSQAIFPPELKHNHASCLLATGPGHFLAAWYSGSGERGLTM